MTQSPRISLTNLIALAALAVAIFTSAAVLYAKVGSIETKVDSKNDEQRGINDAFRKTDERLEARELAIDAKLNEIRDSQIRMEEQIKKHR